MLVVVLVSADRGMLVGWLGTGTAWWWESLGVEVQAPGPGSWSRLVVLVQVQGDGAPSPKAADVHGRRWSGNPGTRRGSHSDAPDGPAKEEEAVIT